jgi:hypothetical protein
MPHSPRWIASAGWAALSALCVVVTLGWAGHAHAWVLQVPRGSGFATLPQGRVLCGPTPEGWTLDPSRKRLKADATIPIGQTLAIVLAPHAGACKTAAVEDSTLIATGPHPTVDPNSVTVAVDAGRLELRGEGLEGIRIGYKGAEAAGDDVCLNVSRDRDRDVCAINIDRGLPAAPQLIELRWAPPGGNVTPGAITYDERGEPLEPERMQLTAARVLITRMFPEARMVDVAYGEGKVLLTHPESVSGADCGVARCTSNPEGLVVASVPAAAPHLGVRVRLLPRVFFARGETLDTVIGESLAVLRCPVSMVSGAPLRNVDDVSVLLRLDASCAADVRRLHFTGNSEPASVTRVETLPDGVYVLLWIGRVSGDRLTVVVSRDDGSVLGVSTGKTTGVPPVMATLSLAGYGEVQFIPRNRPALVNVSHVAGMGQLVPVTVPGAYLVTRSEDGYHVRGVYAAGGYASLRFAYRISGVPPPFTETNFGEIVDPVQRPIREASIPAPIGASSVTDKALVELFCKNAQGKLILIKPGSPIHIPFIERDSCRLKLHRERIPAESGEQRLDVDVTITAVSGADRGEAHFSEQLALRHSKETEVIWIRGAKEQFDRINVRITHVIDQGLFDNADIRHRLELPSAQWTVVTENARFKFYATAAMPASLYRFSADGKASGTLSLNLGLLTRITWLDNDGREGLLALEAGMMGMGLADQVQRKLALVGGLGISIPLGNVNQPTQAAINIHMWLSYNVGETVIYKDPVTGMVYPAPVPVSSWAMVFGPSITIGSIGALL